MNGDLAAFLAARLGEDEAAANEELERRKTMDLTGASVLIRAFDALDDPGRQLREVAAKRAILANYGSPLGWENEDQPGYVIRVLAAVYDVHPAYRPEWKP